MAEKVTEEERRFANTPRSQINFHAESIKKRMAEEVGAANPNPRNPLTPTQGGTQSLEQQRDMERDPTQTKLAISRSAAGGKSNYKDFMYISNEAEAEYQKNQALVEANFGASAKKKSALSGRPGSAPKSGGGASLYNQSGTGLYSI